MTKLPVSLVVGLLLCSCAIGATQETDQAAPIDPVLQQELVVATVTSGRNFRGLVDPRTDGRQLWIRCIYGQAVILRPVLWERIVTVQFAGQDHAAETFRGLADRLKRATPRQPWPAAKQPLSATMLVLHPMGFNVTPPCLPAVRSLHAAVHPANWDADGEVDGLAVVVAPLDDFGALLPVEGTVEVTLYGYDRRSGLPLEHWSQLARWSQPVNLACYGSDGGMLRLPFDGVQPDWEQFGSPRRMLRVRLQAPGHGTFEAEIPYQAMRRAP